MMLKLIKVITNVGNPFIVTILLTQALAYYYNLYDLPSFLLIVFLQIGLPVITILIMMKMKIISDFEITDRSERTIYFINVAIFFILAAIFSPASSLILILNSALFLGIITLLMVSLLWKISGHMLINLVCLAWLGLLNPLFWLSLPFFVLVGYTRIKLKKHDWLQVTVGAFTGVLILLTSNWAINEWLLK